jgi:hypothetical protein
MWKRFLRDLALGMAATNPIAWYYLSSSRLQSREPQEHEPVEQQFHYGDAGPAEHRTAA